MEKLNTDVRILQFSLDGEECYGVDILQVKKIIGLPPITKVPGMISPCFKGMISLRSELIPVIDLNLCLGLPENPGYTSLMITDFDNKQQGFIVNAVTSLLTVSSSLLRSPPVSVNQQPSNFKIIEFDKKLIHLIDFKQLLDRLIPVGPSPTAFLPA